MKRAAVVGGALALMLGATASRAQDTIIFGVSVPLSGAAASWGIGTDWAAQQAAKDINAAGGIKMGGKSYKVEVRSVDNKYTAGDGAKTAETLISRDKVKIFTQSVGTAPVKAIQSLTERENVLLFTSAWGRTVKGKDFPLTFTIINTPDEVLKPIYSTVKQRHAQAKTVVLLNPNDASGQDTAKDSRRFWEELGIKVVGSHFFERSTTEFQPIATKIAADKSDILDMSATPPANAGSILKELSVLGWKGVKVIGAGTGADVLVRTAGADADGTYMGLAADFDGPSATPKQRELNAGAKKALNESLNVIHMGGYDGVMAAKAGIEAAGAIDAKKIAEVLPKTIFDISYGKTTFGSKDIYGTPQQMLIPIVVTQIQGGKAVEVVRILPDELKKRLGQ
ncbi:MAG: ABC transporter substrate-binding protein [Hyphomicrobiaceae bacterium]|nr:ABC transporter substrate-binding protein [Hyphomicrobiaceae bacterium]